MSLEVDVNNKKIHSQYYTKRTLGERLFSLIPKDIYYTNIIDLSAGEGALLDIVQERFSNVKIVGVDIDLGNIKKLKGNGFYDIHLADSTTQEGIGIARKASQNYCLALGNPPFKRIKITPYIRDVLRDFDIFLSGSTVRAEVIFLLQSFNLLKDGGVLAFILPDGILTNSTFKKIRELMCSKMNLLSVCEVPASIFSGTEARTHILIAQKSPPTPFIILSKMDTINKDISISREQFCQRGDYKYYSLPIPINTIKLEKLCSHILRGQSKYDAKITSLPLIHTTSLKKRIQKFSNDITFKEGEGDFLAREGDIVLARVGTRSIGDFGIVIKGVFRVSDCIIIIRPANNEFSRDIISTLQSDFGISWLKSVAKGVGALHITLDEIKKLPVFT
jgi:tRNA1(Val) A37 N6-methylase TrmN6